LADPKQFGQLIRRVRRQDWVVYAKPAFRGSRKVWRYLGRYKRRMLSNHRCLAFDGKRVTFRCKDCAHGDKQYNMTLMGTEFLRRFFLHVLLKGLVGPEDIRIYQVYLSESAILVFSPLDSARIASRSARMSWRAIARCLPLPRKLPPTGIARIAGPQWWSSQDSPLWNSRDARTSILPDAATTSGPPTCSTQACAFVCLLFSGSPSDRLQ
jgi:hypothetical protein